MKLSVLGLALIATLGLSAESGRTLVAQALELVHRLPKTWARVQDGSLAPWRARRIAGRDGSYQDGLGRLCIRFV